MAADTYPCKNVDVLSFVDIGELGVSFVNDMWGWTDWRPGRDRLDPNERQEWTSGCANARDPTRPT